MNKYDIKKNKTRKKTENREKAIAQAKQIYEEHISTDALKQVNLPGNMFKDIKKDLAQIESIKDPLFIYEEAYHEIAHLLEAEWLRQFYESKMYHTYLQLKLATLKNNNYNYNNNNHNNYNSNHSYTHSLNLLQINNNHSKLKKSKSQQIDINPSHIFVTTP